MHIVMFLLFGLVVGAFARFIVPGREPGGWVVSMLLGIAGAVLGGYFGRVLGLYREGQPAGPVIEGHADPIDHLLNDRVSLDTP